MQRTGDSMDVLSMPPPHPASPHPKIPRGRRRQEIPKNAANFGGFLQHRQRRQRWLCLVRRADLSHQPIADIAKESGRRLVIKVAPCRPHRRVPEFQC